MTKEQAIDLLDNLIGFVEDNHGSDYDEALKLAIKALEQEPRWIPVSERLPEEHTSVIGTTEFNDIYEAELYDNCGKKRWYADGYYNIPIVAWMPLPEPYKAESEEKSNGTL